MKTYVCVCVWLNFCKFIVEINSMCITRYRDLILRQPVSGIDIFLFFSFGRV